MYFAVLEEIYSNVCCSSLLVNVLISPNHLITCLISFTKTLQIRDQFFLGPNTERIGSVYRKN